MAKLVAKPQKVEAMHPDEDPTLLEAEWHRLMVQLLEAPAQLQARSHKSLARLVVLDETVMLALKLRQQPARPLAVKVPPRSLLQ